MRARIRSAAARAVVMLAGVILLHLLVSVPPAAGVADRAFVGFAAGIDGSDSTIADTADVTNDADAADAADAADDMLAAARAFLETLTDDETARRVQFGFDDAERFNWHIIPRERNGLALEHMTAEQRSAAHKLLRSTLSSQGYLKAGHIMFLETVLREIEDSGPRRDPENYYLSIFGEPSETEPWGWRFEGHHLSLNYSSAGDGLTVTPAFMGANPEEVTVGHATGLRVLAREEDLARALAQSLTAVQREQAILSETAPDDILTGYDRRPKVGDPEGLPASEMTAAQRASLRLVVEEYVRNTAHEIASYQMARIDEAGFDNLYFGWAGSMDPDEPHYYRIQGPTVVFEYDNTQNGGRHPHSVWRDLTNDFGEDLLKKHYEESRHH